MLKIGYRGASTILTEKKIEEMRNAGLEMLEIGVFKEPELVDYKVICGWAKTYDINVCSSHLPYNAESSIIQQKSEDRVRAIEINRDLIARASDVGIKRFVLHPSPIVEEERNREECKKYAMEAFDALAEYAHSHGAIIAVEDMRLDCLGNSADELLEMISVNDKLRVCFDVNHLFNDTHVEFIDKLKDKIVTVHISDYDHVEERHWLPGEGVINWHELYNKLIEVGYNGPWMYEVGMGIHDRRSRPLDFTDLYNNAIEIFSGKPLSRI
ncbi:MAG: sugar phosphate isomerase/epimerase [Oscillospiraceae bacterium]|nr:sugar phosphate isomerase/epimerase [Oscillospiraceae bacterium]